ncbi:hypothetical protein OC835_006725 [Tilletia horrida]|nr:hypothetical protein OC835_006725 [Tilletia horrida]
MFFFSTYVGITNSRSAFGRRAQDLDQLKKGRSLGTGLRAFYELASTSWLSKMLPDSFPRIEAPRLDDGVCLLADDKPQSEKEQPRTMYALITALAEIGVHDDQMPAIKDVWPGCGSNLSQVGYVPQLVSLAFKRLRDEKRDIYVRALKIVDHAFADQGTRCVLCLGKVAFYAIESWATPGLSERQSLGLRSVEPRFDEIQPTAEGIKTR